MVLPDDVLEVRGPISNGDPYNNKDGNSNLKSIDLKNVRILTGGALSDCVALESVTLPDSLIALGDGVFSGAPSRAAGMSARSEMAASPAAPR